MPAPLPSLLARYRTQLLPATAAWTALGVVLYLTAPLAAPLVLLLSLAAPLAWCLIAASWPRLKSPSPVILALLLAGAYLALNATWSLSPSTARSALIAYFLFIAVVHVTLRALEPADSQALAAMSLGLYAGIAIAGLVVCFEALSQQWGRRLLVTFVPALRPHPRDMFTEGGWVTFLQPFLLNRSIAALTFLLWPALLAVNLWKGGADVRRWLLLGLLPIVAAVFGSQHATSKIAFAGSVAAFAACRVRPAATRRVIAVCWIATLALVVPVAGLAYKGELYLANWLPRTAKHRLVIWGYTAGEVAKAPILGAGIHTARALHDASSYDAPLAPGSEFRLDTGLHSHNVYLQTWYETGAVGALLLLGIGLLVLRSLTAAPPEVQPYLYATFVTGALAGGSSFSLWQPWFMASIGLATVFAALGWTRAERPEPDP
jgi:O-antigen ligase